MNEHFFIYNGDIFRAGVPVITVQNHSFRYGDGLFETMRLYKGKIINYDFHFQRLLAGMHLIGLKVPSFFSPGYFINTVNQLLSKNFISQNARIRLMVFGGDGGLFEIESNSANYVLETFPLSDKIELNEEGLIVDVFPGAAKSCDKFANLKSNNYLTSVMTARFAKNNNLDDAVILNAWERICESSIANIFIVKSKKIFTPPLSEGCVAGVMRRGLIENFGIEEKPLSVEELLSADELFLTNSIQLLKWVKQFRNKTYGNQKVKEIFKRVIETL